jgi:oxygen-independent coproporphyrinogen-3 oxidase
MFFGGGTPSLMPPETVAALIEAAGRHWGFAPGIEITLEANPSSVEAARFADLARAGVNRVSLGLQALDEEALRFLGRAHGLQEGLAALDTAQLAFDRVSFDLIYALPGQSEEAWAAELARALSFGTGHLSLYQLTIEPGTRFAALHAKGQLPETDPDHGAQLYDLTRTLTEAAGLPAYEISNHARPGEESRHNLAYWRYRPYLGVGPGAHGRRGRHATQRHKKPENWLNALARNGHGIAEETPLTAADAAVETLLMGLRLRDGVALRDVEPALDWRGVARMESQGLVLREGERLMVAPRGMLLLDAILGEVAKA